MDDSDGAILLSMLSVPQLAAARQVIKLGKRFNGQINIRATTIRTLPAADTDESITLLTSHAVHYLFLPLFFHSLLQTYIYPSFLIRSAAFWSVVRIMLSL